MTGDYSVFPSILPGRDESFVDDEYQAEELQRMDWQEIRGIAAAHESEEIDGQSDREEMEAFLVGEKRVDQ